MAYINYTKINSLEKIEFIAGNTYTLEFIAYQDDNVTPLDLGGASVKWALCPYGQADYTALEKTGTITDTNKFEIVLNTSDTENLDGTYIHQPVIIAFTGETYRPAQGVIIIAPQIPVT